MVRSSMKSALLTVPRGVLASCPAAGSTWAAVVTRRVIPVEEVPDVPDEAIRITGEALGLLEVRWWRWGSGRRCEGQPRRQPGRARASGAAQHPLDDDSLAKYAATLSLDPDRVSRELASHVYARRVAEDLKSGRSSGLRGTPTFFIDDARYDGTVALHDMLAAIRKQHPDLEVAAAATNPRKPRVRWPHQVDSPQ
jgi:hypothetical protein